MIFIFASIVPVGVLTNDDDDDTFLFGLTQIEVLDLLSRKAVLPYQNKKCNSFLKISRK